MIKKRDALILVVLGVFLVIASYFIDKPTEKNKSLNSDNQKIENQKNSDEFSNSPTTHILIPELSWIKISDKDLGITFDYPVIGSGSINFEYQDFRNFDRGGAPDPNGISYSWELLYEDGSSYKIAGGISKDYLVGRDYWYTDFYQLNMSDYDTALKKIKTKYSTDAVILDASNVRLPEYPKAMLIKINLPEDFHTDFKGLAIYSRDGFTDEQIKKILNSLELKY